MEDPSYDVVEVGWVVTPICQLIGLTDLGPDKRLDGDTFWLQIADIFLAEPGRT